MRRFTDQDWIEMIRQKSRELGRTPKVTDFPRHRARMFPKYFGSWKNALWIALGEKPVRQRWSEEDILETVRSMYQKSEHFPSVEELARVKESFPETIRMRFGGLNEVYERALGTSPRLIALRAIQELTPPSCDRATSTEVEELLRKRGPHMRSRTIGITLAYAMKNGFLVWGRYGTRSWWSLTPKGREFLKGFKNEKA